MAVSLGLRALAATAVIATAVIGGWSQSPANAARPDRQVIVNLVNGTDDGIYAFQNNPPANFANSNFNDADWQGATLSPCADPTWALPTGGSYWTWAGICSDSTGSIVLRRDFTVSARSVLSGRLDVAIHGGGFIYLNGHAIGESDGNPVQLDISGLVRGNGARNALAIVAGVSQVDGNAGISYRLQLALSGREVDAFTHGPIRPVATPVRLAPAIIATPGGGIANSVQIVATPVASTTVLAGTPTPTGPGVCAATTPLPGNAEGVVRPNLTGIYPVYAGKTQEKPTSTGWARSDGFVVTRLVDANKILTVDDMPSVKTDERPSTLVAQGTFVRASAVVTDEASGVAVLQMGGLPGSLTASGSDVSGAAIVVGYSRRLNCMAVYPTQNVGGSVTNDEGVAFNSIDFLPFQDGVDGGVVFSNGGAFGGTAALDVAAGSSTVSPMVLPFTTTTSIAQSLINTLGNPKLLKPGQHIRLVASGPNNTTIVTRIDGPTLGTTTGTPTPTH